ncbi:MAG: DNA methyltransferase [Vicinamibacterales bacterium]
MSGTVAFETGAGRAILGDGLAELSRLPAGACSLLVTSPPFDGPPDLQGDDPRIVEWLLALMRAASHAVAPHGSAVMELGTTWSGAGNARKTTVFDFVSELCRRTDWRLRREFYWYNPRFLTDASVPAMSGDGGFADCVTMVFWFSRSATPRARPGGVRGAYGSLVTAGGNFLTLDDGPDDAEYLDRCARAGLDATRDRFPETLPAYFIELLSEPSDLVVDPCGGTCATGAAAERLGRRWICIDVNRGALGAARLRFPRAERPAHWC